MENMVIPITISELAKLLCSMLWQVKRMEVY